MKIVDYPEVPTDIYSPNYLRFAAMGAFLGFFISVLIICIRQLYNDKIMDEKDIAEYFSDLAILGVIPDLTDAEKSKGNHYSYYGDSD
jgi:capsular polysaccharide biosynthesis protein